MTANRLLAGIRGISEEVCLRIDELHNLLEHAIKRFVTEPRHSEEYVLSFISDIKYHLQELLGFDKNPEFHTWNKRYLFKKQWVGTTWECVKTGERFTIPYEVEECDFYKIGEGFLDVGRYRESSRGLGVKEVST